MIHKRLISALGLAMAGLSAFATVEWLEKSYDFGRWDEDEGLREGSARMVNKGPEPVLIRRVQPSCGCTGVSYPEEPIAPGDTATILFNYNPEGRPGAFEKTIRVYLDNTEKPDIIHIKGTVIGAERSLTHRYPVVVGPMRLAQRIVDLGDIEEGKFGSTFISAYNSSSEEQRPSLGSPEGIGAPALPLEFKLLPSKALPGEVQTLIISLDAVGDILPGRSQSRCRYCLGDECTDIIVRANILPKKQNLTSAQLASAPMAALSTKVVELPTISTGSPANGKGKIEFQLTNEGKSDLIIRRIYSPSGAIEFKKYPEKLKPCKSCKITGTLYANALSEEELTRGIATGTIEVITTDPLQPILTLRYAAPLSTP